MVSPGFTSPLKVAKHYFAQKEEREMGDVGPFPPVMVDLHPTLACNCKCYFCIAANHHVAGVERPNFDRKHTLDWEVLKKVVDEFDCMGVRSIQLTGGGEPTMYPQFADLLEEIRPHRTLHRYPSPRIGLITNGVLAGEYAEDILGACDWVRISLDASNKEMYKQIKSADHFDEVIASLEKLLEGRGRRTRPRIGVAYIITPESIDGIEEVCQLMSKLKPAYVQFKDVVNRGLEFSSEYSLSINVAIHQAREKCAVPVMYTCHEGGRVVDLGFKDCHVLDYVAVLGADGNVYGCCHREYLPGSSYGSIYEHGFKQVWAKRPRLEIDKKLCWNCRYGEVNKTLVALKQIQDVEFL